MANGGGPVAGSTTGGGGGGSVVPQQTVLPEWTSLSLNLSTRASTNQLR